CFWNKGAERLYGWRADEVAGENVYDVLFPGELQGLDQKGRVLAETGEWCGELRQITKSRRTIIVESRWTLQFDDGGLPKSVLMVNRDITEQKKLQAEMVRAQRIETVGRLATGIAHDLNNVLSTMLISIKALLPEHVDLQQKSALESSQICA